MNPKRVKLKCVFGQNSSLQGLLGKMDKSRVKNGWDEEILVNFAKIFVHSFPLSTTSRITALDIRIVIY